MKRLFVLVVLWLANVSATAEAPAVPVVLVFGDSISAAHGIRTEQGWVALLQRKLQVEGYGYQVINASVSGETTAGGLARLPRALALHHPKIVIIELGGNDGLRALPIPSLRANLAQLNAISSAAGAQVLLVGMRMPPNYGSEYAGKFRDSFDALARERKLPFVPFMLEGIALSAQLMQADGIHPNVPGQPKLLENVWPALQPLLRTGPR